MPINYADYPPTWFTDIRPRVLERAGYRCEECAAAGGATGYRDDAGRFIEVQQYEEIGVTQLDLFGNPIPPTPVDVELLTIILHVAHLDRDEWNWAVSLERLRCLCHRCHLAYDKEDNLRRRRHGKRYYFKQLRLF